MQVIQKIMNKYYVTDIFSFRMIQNYPVDITIDKLNKDEFCVELDVRASNNQLVSALRYENSSKIINTLCGIKLQPSRLLIKLNKGDSLLFLLVMNDPNDKDLNTEVIKWLLKNNKIEFYKISWKNSS